MCIDRDRIAVPWPIYPEQGIHNDIWPLAHRDCTLYAVPRALDTVFRRTSDIHGLLH